MVYFTLESIKYPKSLYRTNTLNPDKTELVCHLSELDNVQYNPEEINIEEHSIITKDGRNISLTLSYKDSLIKDGNNPLIILLSPMEVGFKNTHFLFYRTLFLEKGFIWVERSPKDLDTKPTLEQKIIDLEDAVAYFTEENITSNNKIVLYSLNYGTSIVASALNKNPNICKAVVYTNGIFDMVRHQYLDNQNPFSINKFKYQNEQEFKRIFNLSSYHHIQYKENYPSILLCFDGNKKVNPAHTYKYAAKMQMRTLMKNPVLIYNPLFDPDSKAKNNNLNNYIYHSAYFIFDQLNID